MVTAGVGGVLKRLARRTEPTLPFPSWLLLASSPKLGDGLSGTARGTTLGRGRLGRVQGTRIKEAQGQE